MNRFLTWLATSPLASAAKVGVAASLGYVLADPDILGLPPVAVVGIVAGLPVLINWLNPADTRYGRNDDTNGPE